MFKDTGIVIREISEVESEVGCYSELWLDNSAQKDDRQLP